MVLPEDFAVRSLFLTQGGPGEAPDGPLPLKIVSLGQVPARSRGPEDLLQGRQRPDGANRRRAVLLSGAVPEAAPDVLAAADVGDRAHRLRCRRSGVNPLGADGAFRQG